MYLCVRHQWFHFFIKLKVHLYKIFLQLPKVSLTFSYSVWLAYKPILLHLKKKLQFNRYNEGSKGINYESVWIELIVAETKNWKLKIESTVAKYFLNMWIILWDQFLIFFSAWIVIFVPCTVNRCEITIHAHGKKKNWKT